MNKQANYISNRLKLRDPQKKSLEIFETICNTLELAKIVDLKERKIYLEEESIKLQKLVPTFEAFQREFCNICFSLATGIGKTRLMGAFIAYLYYQKGIKNFFIMAPNITVYDKLVHDFGDVNNPKYVFKGLEAFSSAPRIIDGNSYESFSNATTGNNDVTINIFNIAKLSAETKGKKGQLPRIKRLTEILGQSYFSYLQGLQDLVLLMDESHHYRADRALSVINELNPILGIEVTATPQTQEGGKAIKFKNVVYEYSLAHALDDGKYVKIPTVATRKDFVSGQYEVDALDKIKLQDGINIHMDTKNLLKKYALEQHDKKIVKPLVLIVTKDTTHSNEIKKYITSDDFFNGDYKGKVIEINSNQSGVEKDVNVKELLKVEEYDNAVEIIIHVNMLKEGWDVNNLYTIIPLRTSASQTLTEQTIGRGLRLPYGERTGIDEIDRLTIVHHDKFNDIISLANDPNSLVRRYYFIDPLENPDGSNKDLMTLKPKIEETLTTQTFVEQISNTFMREVPVPAQQKNEVASTIISESYTTYMGLSKVLKNINEINKPENQELMYNSVVQKVAKQHPEVDVDKKEIKVCIQHIIAEVTQMVTDNIIPIPQTVIQQHLEVQEVFYDFDLDTQGLRYFPSDNVMMYKALDREGRISYKEYGDKEDIQYDTPENEIIKYIVLNKSDVDYTKNASLLYKLVEQLKTHFSTYLKDEQIIPTLIQFKKDLAEEIYRQMQAHFDKKQYYFDASPMKPFSQIETGYGEKLQSQNIVDYRVTVNASEVKSRVFNGFVKSCHSLYKFKSTTEKDFASILESDKDVVKWMCPARKQFKIYWDQESKHNYQPDFIVETADKIYMIETKDSRRTVMKNGELKDDEVRLKAYAGMKYCHTATVFNQENGGKAWEYILISHDIVKPSMSFMWLVKNSILNQEYYLAHLVKDEVAVTEQLEI